MSTSEKSKSQQICFEDKVSFKEFDGESSKSKSYGDEDGDYASE